MTKTKSIHKYKIVLLNTFFIFSLYLCICEGLKFEIGSFQGTDKHMCGAAGFYSTLCLKNRRVYSVTDSGARRSSNAKEASIYHYEMSRILTAAT